MNRWLEQVWLFVKLQPSFWGMAGCYVDMRKLAKQQRALLISPDDFHERETLTQVPDRRLN